MLLIERVIGSRHDDAVADRLHRLEHRDAVDHLLVRSSEIQRRRFRATTVKGTQICVALPREQSLYDGAVLVLDDTQALVIQVATPVWLRLIPSDAAAALEVGYHAGNLHWRVKFDGPSLLVAQEGAREGYVARLKTMFDAGRVRLDDEELARGC